MTSQSWPIRRLFHFQIRNEELKVFHFVRIFRIGSVNFPAETIFTFSSSYFVNFLSGLGLCVSGNSNRREMSGSGKGLLGLWLYRTGEEWALKENIPPATVRVCII